MPALVWIRRDQRVHDHPALTAALAAHEEIVPVFCLDDRILHGRNASGSRTQFMLESLADLRLAMRERGGDLLIRRGAPEEVLPALAREAGARDVHVSYDVTPYARARGRRVHAAFKREGLQMVGHPGMTTVDDARTLRKKDGGPFTVFSPFFRAAIKTPHRPVLPAPGRVRLPAGLDPGELPALEALGLHQEVTDPSPGGERAGRARLEGFLAGPIGSYGNYENALGEDRSSRLSPYLHFGCVSPREILERAPKTDDGEKFRRQLYWADFYHHVMYHFPDNAFQEFQPRYRGTLAWNDDPEHFRAWCEGHTGYPFVDAGMRQLNREGWLHNRARLVVASFLIKDLGIDWRAGERQFMRLLIDGDESINNGNWQWIASTGVDPQPFFRRIYNPALHQQRFDPRGLYVRRYVPELARVPDRYLAEPWTMPASVQDEAGCVIGRDYPAPIVDHLEARRAAMERYRAANDEPRGEPEPATL